MTCEVSTSLKKERKRKRKKKELEDAVTDGGSGSAGCKSSSVSAW